ncbi:hypothetical protein DFH07DRAFT_952931 [Mycena maculata]|uniref:Uncharacterized protein n=1 Tax=Mycena maculata TaxID=230809 RepID=A0AAD7NRU8_9AGAR|nr:hypothetical protein DFH07DRAFT_952931 [Mycena maculata]
MARESPQSTSPSATSPISTDLKTKPLPPLKPPGIINLPQPDEEDSPPSSTSDSQRGASLPDLRGAHRTLNRRASTSTNSLNVRFAPLPQLAPRKRRSTAPLGIASRAQMMRRRRAGTPGYDNNGDPLPPTPPMWTDEEVERHTQRILAEHGSPRAESDVDDPFLMLGKMVKGAGRQLWRKVSNKKPVEGDEGGGNRAVVGAVVIAERVVLAPISGDNTSTQEEGGVWEEEVGDRFPLNVGQTETIVEGQYSWSAAQLKPSLEDNGSASDDASGKERNLSSTEGTEEGSSTRESSTQEEEDPTQTTTLTGMDTGGVVPTSLSVQLPPEVLGEIFLISTPPLQLMIVFRGF